jgi:hypothetical protein
MFRSFAFRGYVMLALLSLLLPASRVTYGCMTVASGNQPIQIASEEAVIIWDAAHHREDFIRRATFQTQAHDFGFLVPTPTVPTLAEADPAVFSSLEHLIQPMRRGVYMANAGMTQMKSTPAEVQVLHSQQVAGYQAVILAAGNTKALMNWLKMHGYAASPQDEVWLAPYVQAHWKITAFKIVNPNPAIPAVTSSLVRMSFSVHQPFYPYREPSTSATLGTPAPRLLRVFLLADHPMSGRFQTPQAGCLWPGSVVGVNPLSDFMRYPIARQAALSPKQLPRELYLTTFEDHSSPRPGLTDVIFH